MDKTVPPGAALLLELIGSIEAPKGYGTVYANKQDRLPKPLTLMTIDEVIAAQSGWSKSFGSSAAGRYQVMRNTLIALKAELHLTGKELLGPDMQDRLALCLLRRRGYDRFMAGALSSTAFGLALAQEWASFPVLADCQGAHRRVKRGETYYAGDNLNKVLTKPERVEAALSTMRRGTTPVQPARPTTTPTAPPAPATPANPAPAHMVEAKPKPTTGFWARFAAAFCANTKGV